MDGPSAPPPPPPHGEDEIIIVDDHPPGQVPPLPPAPLLSPTTRPSRLRNKPQPRAAPFEPAAGPSGRVTRASTHAAHAAARAPKKLKLKIGSGTQPQQARTSVYPVGTSFLGPYDRELDSSDEDLAFEEQFILRVPEEGGMAEEMRKRVQRKEVGEDVWFKFKDSRRAVFHLGPHSYSAKLVDLPSIIESQKTLDNKQLYKVADICQMLLVDPSPLDTPDGTGTGAANNQANGGGEGGKSFNLEEFIYPHGITPPLKWVRKRRFRKRVNRMTIESVEQEVERLLEQDARAVQVEFEVLENVDPDMSDSEFEPRPYDPTTPGSFIGEDGVHYPAPDGTGAASQLGEGEEEEEEDDEMDMELAAEIDRAFEEDAAGSESGDEAGGAGRRGGAGAGVQGSASETGSEDEEGEYDAEEYETDEDDEEEEDEEEDEEDEDGAAAGLASGERQRRRLLAEEIADLERACERKAAEVARAGNPVIKKRLEDVLGKLERDLEMRRAQREEMRRGREERRRVRREARQEVEMEEREEKERLEREKEREDAGAGEDAVAETGAGGQQQSPDGTSKPPVPPGAPPVPPA